MSSSGLDALAECNAVTKAIGAKADKNKRRARVSTLVMIGSSAAIPVVLASFPDGLPQKAVASVLAAVVVVVGSWVQLERPHERWVLYRRFHRQFEAEEVRYRYRLGPYGDSSTADRLLAEFFAQSQIDLHEQWEGIVPSSREVRAASPQP